MEPEQMADLPAVRQWMSHAEATSRIIRENYGHIEPGQAKLTATVEENVLVQLENLRSHPTVLAALGRAKLKLHGWVYKFETGQVFAYNPHEGQFESIGEPNFQPQAMTAEIRAI